ncbi:MAG TPA: hypothetical protein VF865_01315 [Acidobacteriaceae bacterium]
MAITESYLRGVAVAFYFDPNDRQLKQKLADLSPTPGYCVFVDIVDSTPLKDQGIMKWAPYIHNTFVNTVVFLPPGMVPLKCLGDALMFFLPEGKLAASGHNALHLFDGLAQIVQDTDPLTKNTKAAAVFCTSEAFELTFTPAMPDVYGKDIDLAARLLAQARPRELVMNGPFVDRVRTAYSQTGNQEQFSVVLKITGPVPKPLKGFAAPVDTYTFG